MSRLYQSYYSFTTITATRSVLGGPQRASPLGGAYSLETYTGSRVGVSGALGPARPEVAEGRGVGRWVRTQPCPNY